MPAGTPAAAAAPLVRTFHVEEAEQAGKPAAQPLFAPAITAELPAGFAAALAGHAQAELSAADQRTIYRLLQDLQDARDEDILQFGEQAAATVDELLKQAAAIMTDPDLTEVGTLLSQTLADLTRHAPSHGKTGWLHRLARRPASWFQRQAELLEARLAELARLEQEVVDDAGRLVDLMKRNEDQVRSLARHRCACLMAADSNETFAPTTRERLGRRAQLLGTLHVSATMTSRQLQLAREHLLDVVERVQNLRFATLPLWRQQFLAPMQRHDDAAAHDQQAAHTHRHLIEQLEQLVHLTTRKTYD